MKGRLPPSRRTNEGPQKGVGFPKQTKQTLSLSSRLCAPNLIRLLCPKHNHLSTTTNDSPTSQPILLVPSPLRFFFEYLDTSLSYVPTIPSATLVFLGTRYHPGEPPSPSFLCPLLRPSYGHLHHRRPALSHRLGKIAISFPIQCVVARHIFLVSVYLSDAISSLVLATGQAESDRWWWFACMDRAECVT